MPQSSASCLPTARSLFPPRAQTLIPLCRSPSRWSSKSQRIFCHCFPTALLQILHRQVPLFSLPTGLDKGIGTTLRRLNSNLTIYSITRRDIKTVLSVTAMTVFNYGVSDTLSIHGLPAADHSQGPTSFTWSHLSWLCMEPSR